MICLGTGISNSNASFPTETTLFKVHSKKGKTDIHVDGKLRNEAFHQTLDDKKRHYIQDGYNNYYFINGNDVQIQIAHQVSRHEKTALKHREPLPLPISIMEYHRKMPNTNTWYWYSPHLKS